MVDFCAILRDLFKTELIDGSRMSTERTLCWNCVPVAVCKVNKEHITSAFKPTKARRVQTNWKFNIHISRSADEAQGDGMESSRNTAKCTFSLPVLIIQMYANLQFYVIIHSCALAQWRYFTSRSRSEPMITLCNYIVLPHHDED